MTIFRMEDIVVWHGVEGKVVESGPGAYGLKCDFIVDGKTKFQRFTPDGKIATWNKNSSLMLIRKSPEIIPFEEWEEGVHYSPVHGDGTFPYKYTVKKGLPWSVDSNDYSTYAAIYFANTKFCEVRVCSRY